MLKKPPLTYAIAYKSHGSQNGVAKRVIESSQPRAVASRQSTVRRIIQGSWAISSSSLESALGAAVVTDGLRSAARSVMLRLRGLTLIGICLSLFVASNIFAS